MDVVLKVDWIGMVWMGLDMSAGMRHRAPYSAMAKYGQNGYLRPSSHVRQAGIGFTIYLAQFVWSAYIW